MSLEQRPLSENSTGVTSPQSQPLIPQGETQRPTRPAIFVMRDRLICEEQSEAALTGESPHLATGAVEALRILARLDMPVVLLIDQACISRSATAREALAERSLWLMEEIRTHGGRCDALFVCPHAQHEACACHMPQTGLFKHAAQTLDLDLTRSALICDTWEQACAAVSVRCQPLLTLTERGRAEVMYPMWAGVRERVWYAADAVGAAQSIEATVQGQRLWRELHSAQASANRSHNTANSPIRINFS